MLMIFLCDIILQAIFVKLVSVLELIFSETCTDIHMLRFPL